MPKLRLAYNAHFYAFFAVSFINFELLWEILKFFNFGQKAECSTPFLVSNWNFLIDWSLRRLFWMKYCPRPKTYSLPSGCHYLSSFAWSRRRKWTFLWKEVSCLFSSTLPASAIFCRPLFLNHPERASKTQTVEFC